jgi:hypothetical protein
MENRTAIPLSLTLARSLAATVEQVDRILSRARARQLSTFAPDLTGRNFACAHSAALAHSLAARRVQTKLAVKLLSS